ncbi:MAG: flagellar basal body P-ring formation protein FlgA [Planctomycetes bacterium]|nr:flagellar basal body P-ring formation protein FlgA [Planctomycetota bacterium]
MARVLLLSVLVVLGAVPASAEGPASPSIALRTEALVAGSVVRLCDIADCSAPALSPWGTICLCAAPAEGETRRIEAGWVRARLAQLGAPEGFTVAGESVLVRGAQGACDAAGNALARSWVGPIAESLGVPVESIRVTCRILDAPKELLQGGPQSSPPNPQRLPLQGFPSQGFSPVPGASRSLQMEVEWGGVPVRVEVEIRVLERVWVVRQPLASGATLHAEVLAPSYVERSPADAVRDAAECAHRTCGASIPSGTVLMRRHLVHPIWVRSGRTVSVVGERGALRIRTSGIARGHGRAGEVVEVELPSGARVAVRVVGPDRVAFGPEEEAGS